ncbi:hypothetical protein MBENS4_1161 [Novosphingobium sp. MBES04]|nr:hypothetical protein MBENS4_1161 [Novosphingobium sp. MBES04]
MGPVACPFNALYWHFLERHRDKLGDNHRMPLTYRNWDRQDEDSREGILAQARAFLAGCA